MLERLNKNMRPSHPFEVWPLGQAAHRYSSSLGNQGWRLRADRDIILGVKAEFTAII
jgi:hypothetical protein